MEKMDLCCARFDEMYSAGRPVKVEWALKSLTIDMVSEFCFGRSLGALYDDNFMGGPVQVFRAYLHSLHVIKAFPFVRTLSQSLPLWIARRLSKTIEMGNELETVHTHRSLLPFPFPMLTEPPSLLASASMPSWSPTRAAPSPLSLPSWSGS